MKRIRIEGKKLYLRELEFRQGTEPASEFGFWQVKLSGDGRRMAAICKDNNCFIWDTDVLERIALRASVKGGRRIAISDTGVHYHFFVAVATHHVVRIFCFDGSKGHMVHEFALNFSGVEQMAFVRDERSRLTLECSGLAGELTAFVYNDDETLPKPLWVAEQ